MIEKLKQNEELWDLYTKKEEYNLLFFDQYERFPYYLSTQRDIFDPKISKFPTEQGFRPEYPDEKKFAVCLTHDIDVVYPEKYYPIFETAKAFAKGDLSTAVKAPLCRVSKKWNPCWNFREIMELEAKYNAKSSFYFLALQPGEKDFNYQIEEVESELKFITEHGWEEACMEGTSLIIVLKILGKRNKGLKKFLEKKSLDTGIII